MIACDRPVRLRLSRQRGFILQERSRAINGLDAVVVSRPSRWGNPVKVAKAYQDDYCSFPAIDAMAAVTLYRDHLRLAITAHAKRGVDLLAPLRGKNLACWCSEGAPCHADVLLDLANAEPAIPTLGYRTRTEAVTDLDRQGFSRSAIAAQIGVPTATVAALWRHKKRGTTYTVLFPDAEFQCADNGWDHREVVVYRSTTGGGVWVRPASEFHDGRFEQVGTTPAAPLAPTNESDAPKPGPFIPTSAHTDPGMIWPIGTRVEKIKGANWRGRVVGRYSTALTADGYCVESEWEPGSVQIYPHAALRAVDPWPGGTGEKKDAGHDRK